MNKFAFDLIAAINRDGLGNESWGVVENVADTVDYFGSKERVSLSGKWLYLYAEKDAVFSLQLDKRNLWQPVFCHDCNGQSGLPV